MFMYWLMDQEDHASDEVEALQTTLFKDYNNGCLPTITSVKGVLTHFMNKHPNSFIELREQFIKALSAYDKEITK